MKVFIYGSMTRAYLVVAWGAASFPKHVDVVSVAITVIFNLGLRKLSALLFGAG